MAAAVLHDMVLNCDIQGLKAGGGEPRAESLVLNSVSRSVVPCSRRARPPSRICRRRVSM